MTDQQPANWLEPQDPTFRLPTPTELRRMIREALENSYAELVAARGDVHTPEDTFHLQRLLAHTKENFTDWAAAFRDGAKRIAGMQEEQLIDAVGEQDGIPLAGLTVPDPEGDVRLSLDTARVHTFDLDQLIQVVSLDTMEHAIFEPEKVGVTQGGGEELIAAGIRRFLELGKFEPQVSKVTAYAKQVARDGDDNLASVVSGTIKTTTEYKGVALKRS
jgi:hypothetical protein